jgi:hypothetical protein
MHNTPTISWAPAPAIAAPALAAAAKSDQRAGHGPAAVRAVSAVDYTIATDATGQAFEWIDATQGTELVDAGVDDGFGQLAWPFDFSVYDSAYSEGVDLIDVNSNGSLHFDQGGPRSLWVNCGDIPSDIDGQWVAPLGDDTVASSVFFIVTGDPGERILTIEWVGNTEFGGAGVADFQVNLYEGSNRIVTQTRITSPFDFASDGVVGINAGDTVRGTEVACGANGTLPSDDFDVEYTPAAAIALGGSVNGISAAAAACANGTDPQSAFIPLPDLVLAESWSCNDAGVTAASGDTVRLIVTGGAFTTDFNGSFDGVAEGAVVRCLNISRGQSIEIPLANGGAWDCGAAGLVLEQDDRVRATVTGAAE